MESVHKYSLFGSIVIFSACLSILTSQTSLAMPMKNPISLPLGTWTINAAGQKGELNITSVGDDGQVSGTLRVGIGLPKEYYSNIIGLWDFDAWKITFLKENQAFFKNASLDASLSCNLSHPITKQACHGRDQLFTGYLFGGLPCPAQCTNTGASISLGSIQARENDVLKGPSSPIIMAGTLEALGGSSGTGATADRSVFGWVAIHPLVNLTHPVQSVGK